MRDFLREIIRRLGLLRVAYQTQDTIKAIRYRVSSRRDRYLKDIEAQDLPIPPAELIYLVAGTPDVALFLEIGRAASQIILHALQKNGVEITSLQAMLDFGCGCGRIMRYWSSLEGPRIYGTDYNRRLIAWCRKNLAFAHFGVNESHPPLVYEDDKFDLIYAISVFTHLSQELQISWMQEFSRVLKPGGYLLMTTHGESRIAELNEIEREKFRAGRLVVKYEEASGMNLCAAYHPETYVRGELCAGYEVVDFIPSGTCAPFRQDLYLLKNKRHYSTRPRSVVPGSIRAE